MNKVVTFLLALVIVYIILKEAELYEMPKLEDMSETFKFVMDKKEKYVPRSFLDEEWTAVRNDPRRKAGPFNTCSPESFDECAKVAFPLLSRY